MPLAGVKIEGDEAQTAAVRLRPGSAFKVDPGSLIYVPQGVEVRATYGAPQAQVAYQPQQTQQATGGVGGMLSRLRSAPTPAPQQQQQAPTAPMLAELSLQPGVAMPAESVLLGPSTAARLHTVSLDSMGGECYIQRGTFLAAPSSVNIHSVDEPTGIPGFVLQRVDGTGNLVLKAAGQALPKSLAPGEQLFAQSNRIVAVESTVQILGGQGLLVTLVGPGNVVLQSLPSLEVALTQQAEQTAQIMQQSGLAPASQQQGGFVGPFGMGSSMGMGGGLGSMIAQGMAFGVGSAVAHTAFNSMFGGGGHGAAASTPQQPPPAADAQQPDSSAPPADGEMHNDLDQGGGSDGGDGGGFFGGMFGGDEGGDDGGDDGDW